MRILVVNQYFPPDRSATAQLLAQLCEDLSLHHEVTVVAGRPSYGSCDPHRSRGLISEEQLGRVRVLRTWSTTFHRGEMPGRIANYSTYLATALGGALRAERPDVVLVMTDPPLIGVLGAALAAMRKIPFVYVNQDLFPEVLMALGTMPRSRAVRGLAAVSLGVRRRASRLVAIGRDMERRLRSQGLDANRIEVIPNWADGETIWPLDRPSTLREAQGWNGNFVVMHSGNVGLLQDLETFIEAADLLRRREDITFAIVGDGAMKPAYVRDVRMRGLRNLTFLPYQRSDVLADSLGAADLHFIGLRRGLAGCVVPSKTYGVLAAGKPYLAGIQEGTEPAMIADEFGCGVRVDPGDPPALANAIVELQDGPLEEMGRYARKAFEERYDRPAAADAYRRLLEEVVG